MTKSFWDVFPTIEVNTSMRGAFFDVKVSRIAWNKAHTFLHVYLESSHLISHKLIRQMEGILTRAVIRGDTAKISIIEHYELSSLYTAEALMNEYRGSLSEELHEMSPVMGCIFDAAKIDYIGQSEETSQETKEETIVLHFEDTAIARENGHRIRLFLQDIFTKRCSYYCGFEEHYDVMPKEKEVISEESHESKNELSHEENKEISSNLDHAVKQDDEKGKKGKKGKKKPASSRGFIRSSNPQVICGKEFDDRCIPISDIVGEIGEVVIRGKILSCEQRPIRNEKTIIKFAMTDFTDSITVKVFAPTNYVEEIMARLSRGKFVKVKAYAREDSFDHEIGITSPVGIMEIPSFETKREDLCKKKRVELHLHTKMSDMDGVSECRDLIQRAYDWGWSAVAITDHGNVQAFPDANHLVNDLMQKENKKRKEQGLPPVDRQEFFKVIYGVECYLVDDEKRIVTSGDQNKATKESSVSRDTPLENGKYVVFDLETTGFSPEKDRIIEIGAVRLENGKETGRFSEFVNPKIPIPYRITQLTSITNDMVSHEEPIETILPRFLAFCEGCVLVGHNVAFDVSFVRQNAKNLNLPFSFTSIDTIGMARVMLPGHKSYNLDAVGKMLGVVNPHHHRAVDDAETTKEIFVKLLYMFQEKGAKTLEDLNSLASSNEEAVRRLRPYHAVLLAKNTTGRTNLYRLISASHLTYYYQKPKIPKSLLSFYREGLIVGSACASGELFQALLDEKSEEDIASIVRFYDYLEIQPRDNNRFLIQSQRYDNVKEEEDLLALNKRIVELGERYGKMVVATGDVHFLDPEDKIYREIIRDSMSIEEESAPLYLRTTQEMLDEFSYLGKEKCEEVVITNPNIIASWVDAISPVRPDKCPPVIENSDEQLKEICYRKAHQMYGNPLPGVVEDRLKKELDSIIRNGYSVLYIIAQKLVWKSNEDGYLVGSRGSVGSSFAATMAGITEVNPLPAHYYCEHCHYSDFDSKEVKAYAGKCGIDMPKKVCPRCGKMLVRAGVDIPFETFLGFKGDKEPDIDLNFSGEYQAKAHAYTKVIFGHDQTFKAGTIATVAEKTAYGYTLGYCEKRGLKKRKCEIERLSSGCVGVRRSTGQHPGGIVVLPIGEEIHTFTPVQHPANDMTTNIVTTHFDYHSIDHNLLKLDILGHDDPTMIRMLQDLTHVDPLSLSLDDPGVMQLFTGLSSLGLTKEEDGGIEVGTLGVPEFGTRFVMGMLKDTRPTTFSELVKISGLSHGTDVWIGNAADLISEGTCTLSTCIGCRDDIMTYLIQMGEEPSMAFQTMESVRKGKGLKPEMEEAMKKAGVPDWYKDACLKIKYMFPKGHAVAYVTMALRIAWFKVHEPLAYYCAYYTIRAKSFDYEMMAQGKEHLLDCMRQYEAKGKLTAAEEAEMDDAYIVREMYARGIEFTKIQLGVAKGRAFQIVDGKIMPSYTSIRGMGTAAADSLEEACKQGKFVSREDIRERAKISQTVVDKMDELGLLGDLPESNQFTLFDYFK